MKYGKMECKIIRPLVTKKSGNILKALQKPIKIINSPKFNKSGYKPSKK